MPRDVPPEVDEEYPGTAVERMRECVRRARSLTPEQLSSDWQAVRTHLLWAAGLRDLSSVPPGQGNTCHCFADHNHCDATTMAGAVSHNDNSDGAVRGISRGNLLGPGIEAASDPTAGPGGSWCTCTDGSSHEPPRDVAHVQFQSRVAWKLVWCPNDGFSSFVLVDDAGVMLNRGTPTGQLPHVRYRQANYDIVRGGRYAAAAEAVNTNA